MTTEASLEAVECDSARGLDESVIKQLTTCRWVKSKQNILITGATGSGKSFLAAALADGACRHGVRALFVRVPRLVADIAIARVSGAYTSALARLSRIDVLIVDDFLLAPMKDAERRDLDRERNLRPPRAQRSRGRPHRAVGAKRRGWSGISAWERET